MKTFVFGLTVLFLFFMSVQAEVRTWTDKSGTSYEGEYVKDLFEKITLKLTDGKEVRVPLEDLSEADQKYLRIEVPPEISLSFKKDPDHRSPSRGEWEPDGDKYSNEVSGTVTIQKESKRPFTSRLHAELYLIASEVDAGAKNFILMSRTESSFTLLGDGNKPQYTFSPKPFELRKYPYWDYVKWRGEEYLGYLLVVFDKENNIIATKTDIGDWIENPEVIANLRDLSIRWASSIYSRHFDKTGKKVPPPNAPYSGPMAR